MFFTSKLLNSNVKLICKNGLIATDNKWSIKPNNFVEINFDIILEDGL